MLRSKKKDPPRDAVAESGPSAASAKEQAPQSRFDHPQILLLDMDASVETALRDAGYAVETGTWGTPYRVQKGNGMFQVVGNGRLPQNFTEQEIVIIDLAPPKPLDRPDREPQGSERDPGWWAQHDAGLVDPRPVTMRYFTQEMDRILEHAGIFIIFAVPRESANLVFGHVDAGFFGGRETLIRNQAIKCDNWSFLSILNPYNLSIPFETGQHISAVTGQPSTVFDLFTRAIRDHISGASISCTFEPLLNLPQRWFTLAMNKYGDPVAGVVVPATQNEGWIIILPRLSDRGSLLLRLLTDVLPRLVPRFFPHAEGARWVERPDYELPGIPALLDRARQIEEEARARVVDVERQVATARRELGYLHDLLTQQAKPLVEAVKHALAVLGFQKVVDVDAELEAEGTEKAKDEDLRIEDGSPLILVEVKGVRGTSSDEDALQIAKHIAPRMEDLGRTDIRGLTIINHQLHIPALDREGHPFRKFVLKSAQTQRIGLLTTWDLYRLTRSFLKNGWTHDQIKHLFSQPGRIEPIPNHYRFIGTVEEYWPKAEAVGILLSAGGLARHDRIAFELPTEFEEQLVDSLQVEGTSVELAPRNSPVGIVTSLGKEKLRAGVRVYLVVPASRLLVVRQPEGCK